MEIYEVMLDSKQYAQLKSMLIEDRKGDLEPILKLTMDA